MRFLADMGVSMSTVVTLREDGHDAVHLRELDAITLPDSRIVELARAQERVVLTFDLDFGALTAGSQTSRPSIVLFRLRNQTPAGVTPKAAVCAGGMPERTGRGRSGGGRRRRLPGSPSTDSAGAPNPLR